MKRSYEEINSKIRDGDAVVLTAEEVIDLVESEGVARASEEVDVVTTGTFGAMCSSGAFLNFGHAEPPIKMHRILLNDVPTYAGLAAVDAYIGATEIKEDGDMSYGGAHVIEDLVRGRSVHLQATAYGTDCYPRKEIDTHISLDTLNQAYLYNPRNAYQNYAVATNSSDQVLYTYMGKLLPKYGNATYSSAGELSPLLNDPQLKTIGIGTRIFFGGAEGYVSWEGTQFNTERPTKNGVPVGPARALAISGDLEEMSPDFLEGLCFHEYGVSLGVGIGVPIPILDESIMEDVSITNEQIYTPVLDYSVQSRSRQALEEVSYAKLNSGEIEVNGKTVRTSSLSSRRKARDIASLLKSKIEKGDFLLSSPVKKLPERRGMKPLDVRGGDA